MNNWIKHNIGSGKPSNVDDSEYVSVMMRDGAELEILGDDPAWTSRFDNDWCVILYKSNYPMSYTGTGLPTVGCECELKDISKPNSDEWWRVNVRAIIEGVGVWVVCVDGDSSQKLGWLEDDSAEFRPIRTEAEKRREDDLEVIIGLLGSVYDHGEKLTANQILDAGFTRGGRDE